MNRKYFVFLLLLLAGCDEYFTFSDNSQPVSNKPEVEMINYVWSKNSGDSYLSENQISSHVADFIQPVDVVVMSTTNFVKTNPDGRKIYGFDDVTVEDKAPNEFYLVNNTPDKINHLVVTLDSAEQPVLLVVDTELPPFSKSAILFNRNVSTVSIINTSAMFLPNVKLTGNGLTAQQGAACSSVCYSEPDAQQAEVYQILSSNIHKAMNHKRFLPELTRFYIEDRSWGCPSGRLADCDERVANINYMKMSTKGHNWDLKVLSGPYSNEGVGGGASPKLDDLTTKSSGWASIWANYITAGKSQFRPYDGRTQKTLFHEGAHGFGFNHDSGMTYGFADYYGLTFLDTYFDQQDIAGLSELKPSSMIPVLVQSKQNYLKYKLFKLTDNQRTNTVNARVMTEEKIARKDRFVVDGESLYYELEFQQPPTSSVVIQFFDNSSERVFTTREIANFYQPQSISLDGVNFVFAELPRKVLTDKNYIHVNAICSKYLPSSRGAEKVDYQKLWDSGKLQPDHLQSTYYISSNMSQTNKRWRINMKDQTTLLMSSEDRYTPFSSSDSLLCIM